MGETKAQQTAKLARALRLSRARNYRIKRAAGWRCSECPTDWGILVVRVGPDEGDENFTTRCRDHIGDLQPTPGQAIEKEET